MKRYYGKSKNNDNANDDDNDDFDYEQVAEYMKRARTAGDMSTMQMDYGNDYDVADEFELCQADNAAIVTAAPPPLQQPINQAALRDPNINRPGYNNTQGAASYILVSTIILLYGHVKEGIPMNAIYLDRTKAGHDIQFSFK